MAKLCSETGVKLRDGSLVSFLQGMLDKEKSGMKQENRPFVSQENRPPVSLPVFHWTGGFIKMHIVLVNPEIPQNTGNIARTCALTATELHLIRPLGFSLEDRYLKRAGLDYWDKVKVQVWDSLEEMLAVYPTANVYLATTKAAKSYHEINYLPEDILIFGSETRGLAPEILKQFPDRQIKIPMLDIGRSLNLSNSAGIILYEALRQQNFLHLK